MVKCAEAGRVRGGSLSRLVPDRQVLWSGIPDKVGVQPDSLSALHTDMDTKSFQTAAKGLGGLARGVASFWL